MHRKSPLPHYPKEVTRLTLLCTCITLFETFFCRHCMTTTWKCLISRFVEDVNTRQRLSSSLSELRYSLLEFNSSKSCQDLTNWMRWNKRDKVWSSATSRLFTSAEREVKDWRSSEMYQSWHFWDKIGHSKSVGFRFYSAIWRSESRISSRYLEITSISLIYSLTYSRKKELLFWLSRGLNRLTCVTRQIRGDSKLRD